jgi:hypothetical protein
MLQKFQNSVNDFNSKMLNNSNYLMLLSLFNCAILLNYNLIIWHYTLAMLAVGFTIVNLINPKIWWAAVINIGFSFCVLARHFPRMANHCNIEIFIELIILGLISWKILFPKFSLSSNLIQKIIQISLITIYFFTGFHKLNTDFFNPCVSCVNGINERIIGNFTGIELKLPQNLSCFLQYFTIFVEMILPFGLLHFKTRKWTAILLLFFHCWLSFVYYADFSGLATFLIIGSITNLEEKIIDTKLWNALKIYILFTLFAVIVNASCIKLGYTMNEKYFIQGLIFNIGWFVFVLVFFKNYVSKLNFFNKNHIPILSLIVFLISIWSLKAYIGLGNSSNLTMFSNVLTEKNRSNHLIINTKKTKIFDFEEDTVLILKLSDSLKKEALVGYKIPKIEFQFEVHEWAKKYPKTNLNCTLIYKNDTIIIPDLKQSKFNKTLWWYRFVNFRKIQVEGPNFCYW